MEVRGVEGKEILGKYMHGKLREIKANICTLRPQEVTLEIVAGTATGFPRVRVRVARVVSHQNLYPSHGSGGFDGSLNSA